MKMQTLQLHASAKSDRMRSISFLNELAQTYPDCISLAAGAPSPRFAQGFDHAAFVDHYVNYVADETRKSQSFVYQSLFEYGPSAGIIQPIIKRLIATDYGLEIDTSDIVVTVGAQEAMLLSLRAVFRPGDILAITNPSFVGITGTAELLEIPIVPVDEDEVGGSASVDHLLRQVKQAHDHGTRVRAIYVAPDFSNPTGSQMSLQSRRELIDACRVHDVLIIEDYAYGFLADPRKALPPLVTLAPDQVIHIGTFSKTFFPGLRVGFVIAMQPIEGGHLSNALSLLKGMSTVNTPGLTQAVVGGALIDHDFSAARLATSRAEHYRSNLAVLDGAIQEFLTPLPVAVRPGAGGFFRVIELPMTADWELLESCASREAVLWMPLSAFYLDRQGDNRLRVSCSTLEPEMIQEGVRRLGSFLGSIL